MYVWWSIPVVKILFASPPTYKFKNNHIKPEVYFITDQFLGIPVYISEKNGHLSMEHTHPPHTHILTGNRYKVVKNLKERINEIIS